MRHKKKFEVLTKKFPHFAVLAVFLILCALQNVAAQNLVGDFSGEFDNQLRQPFSWQSSGDVMKYLITISQKNPLTGTYISYFTHETNKAETESCFIYIDPMLPPGQYRAEIKVWNILGVLEDSLTQYEDFTVYQAYSPEVDKVSYLITNRSYIYLEDLDNDGIIEVSGTNLFMSDSTRRSVSFTDYFLKNDDNILFPERIVSHGEQNDKITLQFDVESLLPGTYNLFAQDASGLHSLGKSGSEFEVKARKAVDFDIELGYSCLFLPDSDLAAYFKENIFPLSAEMRLSLLFLKRRWGYLGFGLHVNYSYFSASGSGYSLSGSLAMAHGVFIYQIPMFNRRFFWEFRGGAGATYFHNIKFHFSENIESRPLNTISICYDAGTSGILYLTRRFFLEASFDYTFTVNKNDLMGGMLASFGVGWQI